MDPNALRHARIFFREYRYGLCSSSFPDFEAHGDSEVQDHPMH